MAGIKELLKLKTFFSGERRAMAALAPPEDFAAQIEKLVEDYALREQALPPAPVAIPAPKKAPALKQRYRKTRRLSPAFIAACAMAALIICAISLTLPGNSDLAGRFSGLVEIKAAYAAGSGIDVNQGFIISASQPLNAELVERSLRVFPEFPYQLEEEDDSTFRVLPVEPLAQNTVYHLSFDPERVQEDQPVRPEYSWSFQTEPAFAVLDVLPGDTALSLTFNKAVGAEAETFIVIEPDIDGVWQADGQKLDFLPTDGWAADTAYTVRLEAGLPALDGSLLEQGHISRFQSAAALPPPPPSFIFEMQTTETVFKPEQIPAWPLIEQAEADDSPYILELYTLADAAAYAQALQEGFTLGEETAEIYELLPVLTEQDEPTLSLGYSLPPGFYAARLTKQGCERQLLFQISPLTAYVSFGEPENLFWLHDEAGRPLDGASITGWPDGAFQAVSDEQGIAVLPAPLPGERLIYSLEAEQGALVISVAGPAPSPPEQRRVWLYTDQPYYSPGQTLRFFGVCQPGPGQLRLSLKSADSETPLPFGLAVEQGAFSGELLLPGLRNGSYELALYADGAYIGGRGIEVGPSRPPLVAEEPPTEAATDIIEDEAPRLLVADAEHRYLPEEPVELQLWQNGEPIAAQSVLFVLASPSILAYSSGEEAETALMAVEEYPAEFSAWAVCYADGQYYPVPALALKGAEQPKAYLSVEVDAALLSLRLSDAAGMPLAAVLQVYLSETPLVEDDFVTTPTALFVTLATDEEGRAELELDPALADRLWFLGWRAYVPQTELLASGSMEIDLRPPLSIESLFAGPFAAGDAPMLRLNANGPVLTAEDQVDYHITLEGLDYKRIITARAGRWQDIQLPALPAGDYELLLSAASGAERATKLLPFTVQPPQRGAYTLLQQALLKGSLPLEAGEEPATLIFSGKDKAAALDGLFALANRDAARLDYKLAALFAARLLREDFGWREAPDQVQSAQLPLYQRGDGGLTALPQAMADKTLSALAAPLLPPGINREALAAYLRQCYAEAAAPEDKALALYGLAGLREPVLLDIEQLLAEQPGQQTRLYLALAYFASGHGAAAKALAVELLPYYAAQAELPGDIAAHLALLATIFELPEAEALIAALPAAEEAGYAQVLAQAQILAARCQSLPPNGFFSYQLDGQLHQIRLREHGHYIIFLTPRELAALNFSDVAGDVALSVIRYQEDIPAADAPIHITRYYQEGEVLLQFSLPAEAPPGYYRIDDTLPAGLRFLALDRQASSRRLWLLGDAPSFIVYKGKGAYHGSITYSTRVHMPGRYSAAAPRLRALVAPDIIGIGEAQEIEIK